MGPFDRDKEADERIRRYLQAQIQALPLSDDEAENDEREAIDQRDLWAIRRWRRFQNAERDRQATERLRREIESNEW